MNIRLDFIGAVVYKLEASDIWFVIVRTLISGSVCCSTSCITKKKKTILDIFIIEL